jgi:hypothetical protein
MFSLEYLPGVLPEHLLESLISSDFDDFLVLVEESLGHCHVSQLSVRFHYEFSVQLYILRSLLLIIQQLIQEHSGLLLVNPIFLSCLYIRLHLCEEVLTDVEELLGLSQRISHKPILSFMLELEPCHRFIIRLNQDSSSGRQVLQSLKIVVKHLLQSVPEW